MSFEAGTRIGRYEIAALIGAGGMGEVYRALDVELGRPVALKFLLREVAADQKRMTRFIREAKAASALNHPNILTVHEIGTNNGMQFISTEFVEGETLRQRLVKRRIKVAEALDIGVQVASALAAAHAAKVVHRDIKPENLMLRSDGLVKVLDFGLAKLGERGGHEGEGVDTSAETEFFVRTEPGVIMGTVAYMSPEQAQGLEVDERTDVWSLGAVLYEAVAGRPPFTGKTLSHTIVSILEHEPAPLAQLTDDVPPEFERIVTKALAKDPDERYQTAKDLLIDLRRLKKRLEFEAEMARSSAPELGSTPKADEESVQAVATGLTAATPTDQAPMARQTSNAGRIVGSIKRHRVALAITLSAIVLLILGFALWWRTPNPGDAIESIAVLPFDNQSGNPDAEYLSDGLTESLINSLTRLPNLRVVARSSVFRYKGKAMDPFAVGRELNVRAVLVGRVNQRGDSLVVSVELVDVQGNKQVWGEQYSRKVTDALSVQQEISREISERLRLKLTGEEQKQLARRETTSPEAYQSYLRGRYYWNKRNIAALKKAVEQFEQAIDHDPRYALAYAGLADCYILLAGEEGYPSRETLEKAKTFSQRALRFDESLAEAHTSLALISSSLWQWKEAEEEFRRAIELNSNYPTAHHWYGLYLRDMGRLDESLSESRRAHDLDPLSPVISVNLANAYLAKGDVNASIEQCKKAIELEPNFRGGHVFLGMSYLKLGRYSEALTALEKGTELSGGESRFLARLGYGYAVAGRRAEAVGIIRELEERYTKQAATGQDLASVYVGLGEKDQAFGWLEKDFEARAAGLAQFRWQPQFDSLHTDARYKELLRRMGL
ncbi:MAG TPA: protein kinase [Pyrinomonadaceae bacterium]